MTPSTLFFDIVATCAGLAAGAIVLALAALVILSVWASIAKYLPPVDRRRGK